MKQSLQRRVFQLEIYRPRAHGERFFNTCDGVTFTEIGPCPSESRTASPSVDYRRGLVGADGTLPDGLPTLTREQVDAIGVAGWSVNVLRWEAMT